jgi:hypothetical protein
VLYKEQVAREWIAWEPVSIPELIYTSVQTSWYGPLSRSGNDKYNQPAVSLPSHAWVIHPVRPQQGFYLQAHTEYKATWLAKQSCHCWFATFSPRTDKKDLGRQYPGVSLHSFLSFSPLKTWQPKPTHLNPSSISALPTQPLTCVGWAIPSHISDISTC